MAKEKTLELDSKYIIKGSKITAAHVKAVLKDCFPKGRAKLSRREQRVANLVTYNIILQELEKLFAMSAADARIALECFYNQAQKLAAKEPSKKTAAKK